MIALVGGQLIDGTGRLPGEPETVIVEENRVAAVGPATSTPIPPGSTVIDARGKFLTPGLVDMHVHVYTPEKWHPELFLAA
jgi:imidazolonepropionase-like amidohydrolase